MKTLAFWGVLFLASLFSTSAELDDDYSDYLLWLWLLNQQQQPPPTTTPQQCSPFLGNCSISNNVQCCQYPYSGIGNILCLSDRCLQEQCGYPGQFCGYNIGQCCFHMGLICDYSFVSYGFCVSNTPQTTTTAPTTTTATTTTTPTTTTTATTPTTTP